MSGPTHQFAMALPLMRPLPPQATLVPVQEACRGQLVDLSGQLELTDGDLSGVRLLIDVYPDPSGYSPVAELWTPSTWARGYCLLLISVFVHEDTIQEIDKSFSNELLAQTGAQRESLRNDVLCTELEKCVYDLALSASLAFPGSLSWLEGFAFVNGRYFNRVGGFYSEDLHDAVTSAKDLNWPSFLDVSIQTVWGWMVKLPGFSDWSRKDGAGTRGFVPHYC